MSFTVGIVGLGYVGTGMKNLFNRCVSAFYDPFKDPYVEVYAKDGVKMVAKNSKEMVNGCDMALVCVPTPDEEGVCDTSYVEEAVSWLKAPLIVVKSTVPPGTTERLAVKYSKNVVFSPEYLGEGGYFVPFWRYPDPHDAQKHSFCIFGGPRSLTNRAVDLFSRVMGPHVTYMQTDSITAEFVKYMENVWIAMKVTWANQMFDAAEAMGVDYREARELWALDGRVDKMHTCVWPEKRGFGGKCIPKDLNGFIAACREKGFVPELLEKVREVNGRYQV